MQLPIDFTAPPAHMLARRRDPATSHHAADRVAEFSAGHHAKILGVLRAFGPSTPHEIADKSGLEMHAVARRMKELEATSAAAVVVDAAGKPLTRKTPSGRSARVWYVLP